MENKYFAELARRLRAAGITAGHPEKNRLTVLLNNQPVLSVSAGSDVFLLPAGSNQPEAGELYHKVAQTADEVYAYKKNIAAELETALSIITTAYLRNEDIQTAVEENLEYLNPPVKSVFAEFLARIQLVDPDVDAALQDMGTKIDNAVFREWVAALLACQHDRGLKTILTPIVAKLSDMRIVNGELENMVFEPRKEFIIMQVLVVGNIPLLYFLNRDWFNTLMHTAMGQIILAVCAGVIFVSTAFVIKLTQPIEYRR